MQDEPEDRFNRDCELTGSRTVFITTGVATSFGAQPWEHQLVSNLLNIIGNGEQLNNGNIVKYMTFNKPNIKWEKHPSGHRVKGVRLTGT